MGSLLRWERSRVVSTSTRWVPVNRVMSYCRQSPHRRPRELHPAVYLSASAAPICPTLIAGSASRLSWLQQDRKERAPSCTKSMLITCFLPTGYIRECPVACGREKNGWGLLGAQPAGYQFGHVTGSLRGAS